MPEASAPASSANLGPGFDSLALAYELRCRVIAVPADEWSVLHLDGADFGPDDAVLAAASRVSDRPLRIEVDCTIPPARGLGSSAAAYAAGALAAWRVAGVEPDREDLFALVNELEGHPDNAAAAVHGGFVAVSSSGEFAQLPVASTVRVAVAVPDDVLSTTAARAALPREISHQAAARNVARVAMLIEGLRRGSPHLLAAAAGDELHEPYRAALAPRAEELMVAAREAGAWHVAWSGAGPSVMAISDDDGLPGVITALNDGLAGAGTVISPQIAAHGAA